jgi:prepilin-type N-terminal cleavage/methylation domain-containing protein
MRTKLNNKGFTLVELLMVVAILAVVVLGLLQLFIYTSVQAQMAGNKTLAVAAATNKIEEIRNHTYTAIAADYAFGGTPGNTFTPANLTGKGVVYIGSSNPDLLTIEVDVSWRNKYGRVIGEDTDLTGVWSASKDINGNGKLDSPVKLISAITSH